MTDEIGQSDPVVSTADKRETGRGTQQRFQLCHAFQVANGILRQRLGPAAHHCFYSLRQKTQYAGQQHAGTGDDLLVRFAQQCVAGVAAKEGAEQHRPWGDTTGKLLIYEGASQQLRFTREDVRPNWGNDKTKAAWNAQTARLLGSEGQSHDDG